MAKTYLSPHFTLEELTFSQTATRLGIDNTPPEWIIENLRRLANQLEKVRSLCGNRPVFVTSGYRSPELNKAVGGSKYSQHMDGYAADIVIPGLTPYEVCTKIRDSNIDFDQLIHEFGRWTHFSFKDAKSNRKVVLTICSPGKYMNGIYECH